MRPRLAPLLLVALLAAPALADAPKVEVSTYGQFVEGSMIVLDARKSVSDEPLSWEFKGPDAPRVTATPDAGRPKSLAAILTALPGDYEIKVVAVGTPEGGKLTADSEKIRFTVTKKVSPDPGPPPNPGPGPPPNPGPTPPNPPAPPTPVVTGVLHISYIAEKSEPVAQTRFKRNPAIEKALDGVNDIFRWYSYGEAEPDRLNILPKRVNPDLTRSVDESAFPCVVFQRADGTILKDATLRNPTPDQIVAKVRELRGVR